MDFFISKPISKSKKNQLCQTSEVDYGILLTIYDSGKLGDDTNNFNRVKYLLHEIYASNTLNTSLNVDRKSKVLFDVFSTGGGVADIKYDFINSHIQLFLYDNGQASKDEIIEHVNNSLNTTLHEKVYSTQLAKQQKQGLIDNRGNSIYDLTEKTKAMISEIQNLSPNQENLLINNVRQCLKKYSFDTITKEIITKIYYLYNAHYEAEIDELNSNVDSFEPKERKIYQELVKFVKSKGVQKNDANSLVKDILAICGQSEYLNKISISNLFTSLFKSNKLDEYLDQFNRNIFLDTQVLLQIICYEFKDTEYKDNLYSSAKYLSQQKEFLNGQVKFHTTSDYVEEVAGHLWEANKIKRLLELPFVEFLGPIEECFFNYYNYLREGNEIFEDFDEFVERLFNIELNTISNTDFVNEIYEDIHESLENIGIEIHEVPFFEKFPTYKKDYEIELSYTGNDQKNKKSTRK